MLPYQKRAVKSNNDALGAESQNGTISFLSEGGATLVYGRHSSVGSNGKDVFNHRTMVMPMPVWSHYTHTRENIESRGIDKSALSTMNRSGASEHCFVCSGSPKMEMIVASPSFWCFLQSGVREEMLRSLFSYATWQVRSLRFC